jgi:hypothetical protein
VQSRSVHLSPSPCRLVRPDSGRLAGGTCELVVATRTHDTRRKRGGRVEPCPQASSATVAAGSCYSPIASCTNMPLPLPLGCSIILLLGCSIIASPRPSPS